MKIVSRSFVWIICLASIISGCQHPIKAVKPVLQDAGMTYLYLRPFPQEAERLSFTISSISAVTADGGEVPLDLRLDELKGSEMERQRLLARDPLPTARYRGFSFRVKSALIKGEEGESALLLPEEPSFIDFPFEIKSGRALFLSLTFKYEKSVRGVRFDPEISAAVPPRPLPGLTGYVTNFDSDTITVFDKKAMEAVDAIQTGRGPAAIVIDQRQRRAYVALSGEDAIDVIDVTGNSITNKIKLSPGDTPMDLALTPDGRTLVSVNTGSYTVSIIDPFSFVEVSRINMEGRPGGKFPKRPGSVKVDREGRRAFVFDTLSNTISVIDIPSRSLLPGTITTDSVPVQGDFNTKGDRFAVFQERSPYFLIFDPVSFSLVRRVSTDFGIGWMKFDTATDRLYVGKKFDRAVDIYDPYSFMPGDFINAAGGVSFMAIDGEDNNIFFVCPEIRILQAVNLVSRKTVGEIDLDEKPYWATLMGER